MRFPDAFRVQPTLLLTWGLVAVGHLATEIAIGSERGLIWPVALKSVALLAAASTMLFYAIRGNWKPTGIATVATIIGMAIPLLIAPIWQSIFHTGHALEVKLLIGFRNVSLICLIWSTSPRLERVAVLTSLFTLLFCVSTSEDASLTLLSAVYLLIGVGWLCTKYWSDLRTDSVVGAQKSAPWFLLATVGLLLFSLVFLFAVPEQARTRMVEGFLPSSGGTGKYDPFARSGIGDGDALVAATQEASSFAPIENAPFIEGEEPSLYDVFQDTYCETKPPKKMERAIALPPEDFQPNHHRMAEAKKASKTFSLEREPPSQHKHRHLQDTPSNAILHLVGRVPAHLRETVYDLFDGYEWYPQQNSEANLQTLSVVTTNNQPWIRLPGSGRFENLRHIESHALRIMNVKTNRILAPANLLALHIDRCDRADLFRWAQDGVLAMDRDKLPSMAVIHLRTGLMDEKLLPGWPTSFHSGISTYRSLPVGTGMQQIHSLAREWTAGLKTDLERIKAIEKRLRENYRHHPDSSVPDGCDNPVHWFLTESKQGPDYLFASSAVMLLRTLGISCRAVSGLYADPEKFDFSAQQTSVYPSDAHWWAEVHLGGGTWLTIEPTPGYQILTPPRSLLAQIQGFITDFLNLIRIYWPVSLTILLLASLSVLFYQRLWARMLMWQWQWNVARGGPRRNLRRFLLDTSWLLDRKLQLADRSRPPGITLGRYLQSCQKEQATSLLTDDETLLFTKCHNWAAYSPEEKFETNISTQQIEQVCRRLLTGTRVIRVNRPEQTNHP